MSRIGFFLECNFFITVGRGWQDLFNLCIEWNTIKVWNCDKLRKINYRVTRDLSLNSKLGSFQLPSLLLPYNYN